MTWVARLQSTSMLEFENTSVVYVGYLGFDLLIDWGERLKFPHHLHGRGDWLHFEICQLFLHSRQSLGQSLDGNEHHKY